MSLPFSCIYQGSPVLIFPPSPYSPTTTTTGGTIAASTVVNFSISALVGSTETLALSAGTVTTGSGTSTNTASVQWPAVPGATTYKVYASTGASAVAFVGTVTAPTTSYTWTGTAGSGAVPGASGFAETTLWTCPTGKTGLILGIVASNTTTTPGALYLARNSGTSQRIVAGTPVPPDVNGGQPVDLARKHAFAAGDTLTGYVTVPGIVLTIDALVG